MKAKPVRNQPGKGYVECSTEEATHVSLRIPAPHEYHLEPRSMPGASL